MASNTQTRRSAAQIVSGLFGTTPTPGSSPQDKRQQLGWGYDGVTLQSMYPFAISQKRCASSILTAVYPVAYNPGVGPSQFRQTAGWGYCGLPIDPGSTAVAVVERLPFVYRRRMNRLRARKR
jgi:hypothetical protein